MTYSAVSLPVYPVAPKRTKSKSRFAAIVCRITTTRAKVAKTTRKMSMSRSQRQMKSECSEVLFNIHTIEERVEVSLSANAEPGMGRRCEARLDIFGIQESAARVGLWPSASSSGRFWASNSLDRGGLQGWTSSSRRRSSQAIVCPEAKRCPPLDWSRLST